MNWSGWGVNNLELLNTISCDHFWFLCVLFVVYFDYCVFWVFGVLAVLCFDYYVIRLFFALCFLLSFIQIVVCFVFWLLCVCWFQKPADDKAAKGKKGGAKGKKEEKEAVPTENGETKPEGVRHVPLFSVLNSCAWWADEKCSSTIFPTTKSIFSSVQAQGLVRVTEGLDPPQKPGRETVMPQNGHLLKLLWFQQCHETH